VNLLVFHRDLLDEAQICDVASEFRVDNLSQRVPGGRWTPVRTSSDSGRCCVGFVSLSAKGRRLRVRTILRLPASALAPRPGHTQAAVAGALVVAHDSLRPPLLADGFSH
jgi:hypothetical protein